MPHSLHLTLSLFFAFSLSEFLVKGNLEKIGFLAAETGLLESILTEFSVVFSYSVFVCRSSSIIVMSLESFVFLKL